MECGTARWGVECGHDVMGSGGAARWGVEMVEQRRGVVGSGVWTQRGGERWHGAVGSGDGGVWHDAVECGIGEVGFSNLVILYTSHEDFEPLDPRELTAVMNRA
jgi:hypothetical protein